MRLPARLSARLAEGLQAERSSGQPGALQNFVEVELTCEVAYWVADFARGQRVARRAVELTALWGHEELGLEQLILKIQRENTAALAAALAAGARPTGLTVDEEHKGIVRNYSIYEI